MGDVYVCGYVGGLRVGVLDGRMGDVCVWVDRLVTRMCVYVDGYMDG